MNSINVCEICGECNDSHIGWHYGVVTCQACKVIPNSYSFYYLIKKNNLPYLNLEIFYQKRKVEYFFKLQM